MPPPRSLAFVDPVGWDYDPETPLKRPLGGTQSAVCYLAERLAARGRRVAIFNHIAAPTTVRGVRCLPIGSIPTAIGTYDIIVLVGQALADYVMQLRRVANRRAKLFAWSGHTPDQPAMEGLADAQALAALDGLIMVSRWQAQGYYDAFGVAQARMKVLGNAISPAFAGLFGDAPILAAKSWPPVLAYTSTPYRGLERLLPAFELIRQRIPGARLRVFSSFAVYNVGRAKDPFDALYKRCRKAPGVDYVGSVPQQALANALKHVTALAYPNIYLETSCISVMEAMAAGCEIITSRLGALPETCGAFGHLLDAPDDPDEHARAFADLAVRVLCEAHADPGGSEQRLARQVAFATTETAWDRRADEWDAWLAEISVA